MPNSQPYKTLTTAGQTRKLYRLISQYLEDKHPKIYKELQKKALKTIQFDNECDFSLIQDLGLYGTPHHASETLLYAKKKRDEAVKAALETEGQ